MVDKEIKIDKITFEELIRHAYFKGRSDISENKCDVEELWEEIYKLGWNKNPFK